MSEKYYFLAVSNFLPALSNILNQLVALFEMMWFSNGEM